MTDRLSEPLLGREIRLAVYDHIYANDDHEVGGVLTGSLGEASLPAVQGVIPALEADGQRASVTFTQDAWSIIHRTLEDELPGQQIVGWYHSHPGFGIFLSSADRFIHENFFSDRRQIAYVVDPVAGTEGVFFWEGPELNVLWEGPTERRANTRRRHEDGVRRSRRLLPRRRRRPDQP